MASFKIFILTGIIAVVILLPSCTKDYPNPNQPTFEEVYNSERAVTAIAGGLQRVYTAGAASALYALVDANGFTTGELILRNAGNVPELQLSTGGSAVDAANTVLLNVWTKSNKIIFDADSVISFANRLPDKSYASGLIGFASIFKALSLGNMSMLWESVPDTTGLNVNFIDRIEGFNKAVAVIDYAIAAYFANPPNTQVTGRLPSDVNIINTLRALKARYHLFAGNYQAALDATDSVALTTSSVISFDAITLNPVFESATSTNNVYQPVDSTMGLPADLAPDLSDQRVPFYIGINPNILPRYRIKGFYASGSTKVPFVLPGEVLLIKAEALARLDRLPDALIALNEVVTKEPADDIYGVGAGLSPFVGTTKDEILTEIYRQRCIELFMSGMKLEDMRRFGRPVEERKRNFFPYPFAESDNNPNTPENPEF